MALIECHQCRKEVAETAESCPHCGALTKDRPAVKPKRWYEKTSVTLGVAAALIAIGFGFIHVITGVTSPYELPVDVVLKESFGYRETFVDAARIKALPYLAAKARYPIGCQVLQRLKYLPSGRRFEVGAVTDLRDSLRRWQAEFDKAQGRPDIPWEERFQGQASRAEVGSEDAGTYNQRGIDLARSGQYEAALAAFSRAIRKAPAYAEAFHNRALVYAAIGNVGQAAADMRRLTEIRPQCVEGYLHAGRLHLSIDDYDAASADFARAVRVDPRCAEAYFNRALVHYAGAAYDQAWDDVHRVQELDVGVPPGFLIALQQATGAPDS